MCSFDRKLLQIVNTSFIRLKTIKVKLGFILEIMKKNTDTGVVTIKGETSKEFF